MIDVFADIVCPFTHVGLRRLVARRAEVGGSELLHVRAWPLELVNGAPLAAELVAEEIVALREDAAPDLFAGFDPLTFPSTSLPAMALAAAAYRRDAQLGEQVSLGLREALFEQGLDVGAHAVVAGIAAAHGLAVPVAVDDAPIRADLEEGERRGVEGSPHFFLAGRGYFCPSLDIERIDGRLQIGFDRRRFEEFADRAFARP